MKNTTNKLIPIIFLSLIVICFVFASKTVLAEGVKLDNPIGGDGSIETLVIRLIKYVLGLSGVAALVAFVYGGVMWLISMGDTSKIAKGKNIMIWALLGLVVMFGAYGIVTMIFGALGLR